MKRISRVIIVFTLVFSMWIIKDAKAAEASDKYIKIDEFAGEIVRFLGFTTGSSAGDISKLIELGIIKEGDFKDYNTYLTRGDALVLLSRADDYINKPEISDWLIHTVIDKRISDINDAAENKREDIAKGYIKGFMKGYFNGYYITNRNMKLKNKITRAGALNCIKMIKDTSLRAKISPDGQLIRTKNLPKNADKFDYILESFPNEFYERKFEFMFHDTYYENLDKDMYAFPVEMKHRTFRNWYDEWPLIEEMNKYLYDWQALAEKYLYYLFNVDYRTIDDEWIEGLASVFARSNRNEADDIRTFYIDKMKANKVIIESKIIAVEPSTFYEDDSYCMRAYVKYKITAKDINVKQSQLIYAQYPYLENLKSGEWREGIFDIRFRTNNGSSGDGADFRIEILTKIVDYYN